MRLWGSGLTAPRMTRSQGHILIKTNFSTHNDTIKVRGISLNLFHAHKLATLTSKKQKNKKKTHTHTQSTHEHDSYLKTQQAKIRPEKAFIYTSSFSASSQNCKKRLLASSCSLSVRMEPSSHWMDFHESWYLQIFRKPVRKFKLHDMLTWMTGTLHEDVCTIVQSRSLRMRNVADKSCRWNENTHITFPNFFSENK
jgi:hypothetical protein